MNDQQFGVIFNGIAVIFLVLALLTCLITVSWVSGAVAVPDSLAPKTEVPLPTARALPTLGAPPTQTPSITPTASNTPIPTWTPTQGVDSSS